MISFLILKSRPIITNPLADVEDQDEQETGGLVLSFKYLLLMTEKQIIAG